MIEIGETILWCAALATWLMLFASVLVNCVKALSSKFGRPPGTTRRRQPEVLDRNTMP